MYARKCLLNVYWKIFIECILENVYWMYASMLEASLEIFIICAANK